MMKLKPPHGWRAVGWELAIVTAGVLIALGVQQWADERDWKAKANQSLSAIRDELAKHYSWSVEWRVVAPCVRAQIDLLQRRVEASGSRLDPSPGYPIADYGHFVLRMPSKDYANGAWQAAIADGVAPRFHARLRSELIDHYMQTATVEAGGNQIDDALTSLQTLKRPIPLDPMVRYTLLNRLDTLRGQVDFMDRQSGQLINHVQTVEMLPDATAAKRDVERFGTFQFCRAQGLPMRSFATAMTPVSI
jgi:hypothetical protein